MTSLSRCTKCGKEAVLLYSDTPDRSGCICHCSDEGCDAWMITGQSMFQEISEAIENWNNLQE